MFFFFDAFSLVFDVQVETPSLFVFDAFFFVSDVTDSREELLVETTRLLAATAVRRDEVRD